MGFVDERISISDGQTSYIVRVKSFREKMLSWENGKEIRLKTFSVDGALLKMEIYPNGMEEGDEGYVSVYIVNQNFFDFAILFDISMAGMSRIDTDRRLEIEAHDNYGYPKFLRHSKLRSHHKDKDLEITFTVKKIWRS